MDQPDLAKIIMNLMNLIKEITEDNNLNVETIVDDFCYLMNSEKGE